VFSQTPETNWVQTFGDTEQDFGLSVCADSLGNIYTCGFFEGTIDFDPSGSLFELTSNGETDVFVLKLDANGNFLWANSLGSSLSDYAISIGCDGAGNVYITGSFQETVDFDPSITVQNATSQGLEDIFVQKLNTSGDLDWVKTYGSDSTDIGVGLYVNEGGNIAVTGTYSKSISFDLLSSIYDKTAIGEQDIFVLNLDNSGNTLWAEGYGGNLRDWGRSIVEHNDTIYVTGDFEAIVEFNPTGSSITKTSEGWTDIFIMKINPNGITEWVNSYGEVSRDGGFALALDHSNSVYVTGLFDNTVDFNPDGGGDIITSNGSFDSFVQKLNSNGSVIWTKTFGGIGTEQAHALAVTEKNEIITTGFYTGTVDFDPATGIDQFTSGAWWDGYVHVLDSTGSYVWTNVFGGGALDDIHAVTVDLSNRIIVSGNYGGTVDFNPNGTGMNHTSNGSDDIVILVMDAIVGIGVNEIALNLNAFPNPSNGNFTIEYYSDLEIENLVVTDIVGNVVKSINLNSKEGRANLDLSNQNSGIYFCSLVSNSNKLSSTKLILAH
jgi:hypothetical protein